MNFEPRSWRGAAFALVVALAWCSASVARATQQPGVGAPPAQERVATARDFVGAWESTYGLLELAREGQRVVGTYMRGSSISGVVKDGRLVFAYTEPNAAGEGWFELTDGGNALAGEWREDGEPAWLSWTAKRVLEPEPTFEGLWETSFGRMRLRLDGTAVTGSYSLGSGSRVAGTVEGERLEFTYVEPQVTGEGWFELADDGQGFTGKWRAEGQERYGDWTGTRVRPEPGRVWLVILEAHWETSLADEEYAFGDMLRSYFTMAAARHVQVRQRSFHDEVDFRRFCAEVAYIAEPVVLLISTHGTPEGITVGGTTIGAEAIAESLRDVGPLELLHLSGCSMMNGPVPARILAGLEPDQRFPVSGYSTPVAWDASALADFTFLTFLLIRRHSPQEAVKQAHLAAPFTGSTRVEGSQLRPLGLSVLTPGEL